MQRVALVRGTLPGCALLVGVLFGCSGSGDAPVLASHRDALANLTAFSDATGTFATYSTAGTIDESNEFFASLGTNGRTCASCHVPSNGFSLTPARVQALFDATNGTDPLFSLNDGANSPNADVSTLDARRAAYSMLRNRAVIRVGIGLPANAEFSIVAIDDPYGHATGSELSLFRRPLMSTNLKFSPTIMWDGREPSLESQANHATLGHAQAHSPLSATQQTSIVAFESALFTAQISDSAAGNLTEDGALGGPQDLSNQSFSANENSFPNTTPIVFNIYDSWSASALNLLTLQYGYRIRNGVKVTATASISFPGDDAKEAVYRGQLLFNARAMIAPPTDPPEVGQSSPATPGTAVTCSFCHNSFNAGSLAATDGNQFNGQVAISAGSRRTPDMPLYTLRNNTTGAITTTTDPGRALITGQWNQIGSFKVPVLRNLAARAPYFHDGSAATLRDVVNHYDSLFQMHLTAGEASDLVAFLQAL